ncbi:MAG: hypothetical protein QM270_11285 [Bacillota bacterium]|nr:hypothetical protein [Bacillota bacterium]
MSLWALRPYLAHAEEIVEPQHRFELIRVTPEEAATEEYEIYFVPDLEETDTKGFAVLKFSLAVSDLDLEESWFTDRLAPTCNVSEDSPALTIVWEANTADDTTYLRTRTKLGRLTFEPAAENGTFSLYGAEGSLSDLTTEPPLAEDVILPDTSVSIGESTPTTSTEETTTGDGTTDDGTTDDGTTDEGSTTSTDEGTTDEGSTTTTDEGTTDEEPTTVTEEETTTTGEESTTTTEEPGSEETTTTTGEPGTTTSEEETTTTSDEETTPTSAEPTTTTSEEETTTTSGEETTTTEAPGTTTEEPTPTTTGTDETTSEELTTTTSEAPTTTSEAPTTLPTTTPTSTPAPTTPPPPTPTPTPPIATAPPLPTIPPIRPYITLMLSDADPNRRPYDVYHPDVLDVPAGFSAIEREAPEGLVEIWFSEYTLQTLLYAAPPNRLPTFHIYDMVNARVYDYYAPFEAVFDGQRFTVIPIDGDVRVPETFTIRGLLVGGNPTSVLASNTYPDVYILQLINSEGRRGVYTYRPNAPEGQRLTEGLDDFAAPLTTTTEPVVTFSSAAVTDGTVMQRPLDEKQNSGLLSALANAPLVLIAIIAFILVAILVVVIILINRRQTQTARVEDLRRGSQYGSAWRVEPPPTARPRRTVGKPGSDAAPDGRTERGFQSDDRL